MSEAFIPIVSITEIEPHLKSQQDSLVVFDIDYVLTHPVDSAFQFPNFIENLDYIKKLFQRLTPSEQDLFSNLMVLNPPGSTLIETAAPIFLSQLVKQGYQTIALTASLCGLFEKKDLKEEKYQVLKKNGIDFSTAHKLREPLQFCEFEANFGHYPSYYKGLLFSNGENKKIEKGNVLKAFTRHLSQMPKNIFFVDDREKNLIDVQKAFQNLPVAIHLFLYKGSVNFHSSIEDFASFEKKWEALYRKTKELYQKLSET